MAILLLVSPVLAEPFAKQSVSTSVDKEETSVVVDNEPAGCIHIDSANLQTYDIDVINLKESEDIVWVSEDENYVMTGEGGGYNPPRPLGPLFNTYIRWWTLRLYKNVYGFLIPQFWVRSGGKWDFEYDEIYREWDCTVDPYLCGWGTYKWYWRKVSHEIDFVYPDPYVLGNCATLSHRGDYWHLTDQIEAYGDIHVEVRVWGVTTWSCYWGPEWLDGY